MWQTDIVTIQDSTQVNVSGSIDVTWADTINTVKCDVQDVNKETVFRDYGIVGNEFKQVFDLTQSELWVKGNQVKFDNEQYWVKLVNGLMGKIGFSNHVFVILMKVI